MLRFVFGVVNANVSKQSERRNHPITRLKAKCVSDNEKRYLRAVTLCFFLELMDSVLNMMCFETHLSYSSHINANTTYFDWRILYICMW